MCGRFVSSSSPDEIAKYFGAESVGERVLEPNHNVAPTSQVYAVHDDGGVRAVDTFHWGLVPFWAKDLKIGNRMINARAETIAEKNAFKRAFAKRRCIIPVDGFYEWTTPPGQKKKQPMYIHRPDGDPMAFAGLWEVWRGPNRDGRPPRPEGVDAPEDDDGPGDFAVHSCTIITGEPNEKMAEIHHRMPVMLPPDAWDPWLDPDLQDVDTLGKFLVPAPSELITMHPVSTEVNNARNRGAHLIEEIDPAADRLFDESR